MPRHLFADIFREETLSLHDKVMLGLVQASDLTQSDIEKVGLAHELLIHELEAFMLQKSIYCQVMLK